MRKHWYLLVAAAAWGCAGGQDLHYNPAPQILPQNIRRVALHPIINKTEQFGMEDKLLLDVRDAFLADGRYPLVPEAQADGVAWITITRYLNTPIQFDSNLIPKSYKLLILVDLEFVDSKQPNQALWAERNIQRMMTYAPATAPGGMTEEQAREQIWPLLASDIVKRTIDGFGAITGASRRMIQGDAPSTAPMSAPDKPMAPVTHPY